MDTDGSDRTPPQIIEPVHAGQLLRAAGWSQGSIVDLGASVHFAFESDGDGGLSHIRSTLPNGANGTYIVATQTCDIVANPDTEPFVELILSTPDPDGLLRGRSRSGTRWFDLRDSTLVLHSAYRITLKKDFAASLKVSGWPSTIEELERFRRWLEKRQGRVALPDELSNAIVAPLREVIDGNRTRGYMKAINKVVDEIRMTLPMESNPPYEFSLLFLMDGDLSASEAAAFENGLQKIHDKFSASKDAVLTGIELIVPEELSLQDYRATVFVDLDMVTNSGKRV